MSKDYSIYDQLDKWLEGISDEIFFWNNYMKTSGGIFDKNKWKENVSKNRTFVLENDIPSEFYGKEYDFVDVGSGPFSRCGFITDKVKLNHCAVDPLAEAYEYIKNKNNIETQINLKTGFVEILDKFFEADSFDMVHMSNSLDHSFDPILGIYQLLNICRIGGKVILRHKENEAENARYQGFHQWNLSVNVKENTFVIWRENETYNINELFSEYADIKCSVDSLEPIFNRVELIKKRAVSIPGNNLYDIMLKKIYPFMINTIMKNIDEKKETPKQQYINAVLSKLNNVSDDRIKQYLDIHDYKTLAVYGLGTIGQKLAGILDDIGMKLIIIDQRNLEFRGSKTIHPDDYAANDSIDAVIITSYEGQQELKDWFIDGGCKKIIYTAESFANDIG